MLPLTFKDCFPTLPTNENNRLMILMTYDGPADRSANNSRVGSCLEMRPLMCRNYEYLEQRCLLVVLFNTARL